MSKACIKVMDEHIKQSYINSLDATAAATSATSATHFKPSSCYDDFYRTKMTTKEMTTEIGKIIEKYEKLLISSPEELTVEIMDKIKKTYKNRYYKYTSSKTNAAAATATAE